MRIIIMAALASAVVAAPAHAEAPLATEVYGATVAPGLTEFEARYGRLTGGDEGGAEATKLEVAHGFSNRFWAGVVANIGREPHGGREFEGIEVEGRYAFGRVGGIDLAGMLEYELNRGPDVVGGKLIAEKRAGEFDARINFNLEKALAHGEPVEFGYAALVTQEVVEHLHLGAMAVGGLGDEHRFGFKGEDHFAGPIARLEFEPEGEKRGGGIEIEAGYLFALGAAREGSDGQIRLGVDYEVKF